MFGHDEYIEKTKRQRQGQQYYIMLLRGVQHVVTRKHHGSMHG